MYFPQILPLIIRRSILLLLPVLLLSACGTTPVQTSPTATPSAQAHVTPTVAATPTENVPTLSTPLVTYKGHQASVISIAWSPDGKQLVSCSDDATVQEWSATTGHPFWTYTFPSPRSTYLFAVSLSPDGKRVATAGNTGIVAILDAANGHLLANFNSQSTFIEGLAWSPDGKRIALGDGDNTVEVLNAANGNLLLTYKGHSDHVTRIAWSPDGKRIASASHDGTVQVWNATTGQTLLTYRE